MKNLFINFPIIFLLITSCTDVQLINELRPQDSSNSISILVSAPEFISVDCGTKSVVSTFGAFTWSEGDKIGLFSNKIGSVAQTPSQLALTLSAGEGTSTAYSSTTGWALVPGDDFNYFSYCPYSETNTREQITIDYTGQTQTLNNSTASLGAYDYMYSDMVSATSSSAAYFSFLHIGCLVNVNITVPSEYESTTFYHMRLYTDTQELTYSATYSVNDIMKSGAPVLNRQTCDGIDLSFGDEGIKPTEGVINAWLIMAPTQWSGKTITSKLYAAKNNIPTLEGLFTPDDNLLSGIKYSYSVTMSTTEQDYLDKPVGGEQLHVLLFGHSFGLNSTEYLPQITYASGIKDVHYGRWYQGNCSLKTHWKYVNNKLAYTYYNSIPISGIWAGWTSRYVDDVLSEYPWDIIIFQQSIGFEGEGNYSSYQPELSYLKTYVKDFCENAHNKVPLIGWNMFWGYNSEAYPYGQLDYADYDRDATDMYKAIVNAAKSMLADEECADISLVIPTGTALQNARGTRLNDPGSAESPSTTRLLTRDGYHASFGIGYYVTACAWYQYLIAPIYSVNITGNSYRPKIYSSFEGDDITDERAAICWKCAIAAVENPYEVSTIEE